MTTFLGEILNARGTASVDEFRDMLGNVEAKLGSLKVELVQALQSCFIVCDGDADRVSSRLDEINNLNNDITKLLTQISCEKTALLMSEEELVSVNSELVECERNIQILQSLVTIVQGLDKAETEVDFLKSSRRVMACENEFTRLLSEFPSVEGKAWISGLKSSINQKSIEIVDRTLKEWNAKFNFTRNTLVIDPFSTEFIKLVETLKNLKHFTLVWEKFSNQIWMELLCNLCSPNYAIRVQKPQRSTRKSVSVSATEAERPLDEGSPQVDFKALPVNQVSPNEIGDATCNLKVVVKVRKLEEPYASVAGVFHSILVLVQTLHQFFDDDESVMQDLAELLAPRLVNKLFENCLKGLILEQSNGDRQKASKDVEQLRILREKLAEFGFSISDEPEIMLDEFESNFDGLFMNQLREDVLAKIRTLVKSDVHQTMQVGPAEIANSGKKLSPDQLAERYKNPYWQQGYKISIPVHKIVEILQDHLSNYADDTILVEHAFNLFISIVAIPKYEAEAADFLPLTSILIHNNCVFLSHHAEVTFPFCEDKISLLNSKASQAIAFMMRSVRTKVNAMISSAMTGLDKLKFSNGQSLTKFLVISAELEKLYNIFKDSLPRRVCRTTLQTLVDHTVNEMCNKLLSWDDISASCADEVAESFTKFAVAITTLFKKEAPENASMKEIEVLISKVVHKWDRFRNLTFILTASMKDIEDKWVNGCGPLSQAFTAEELRKLVRALFQNTDRRAAFLASIK